MEEILRKHQEVGQEGDSNGVSLLRDTLWVSFTDRQPNFGASSQPNGHLGIQVADVFGSNTPWATG